VNRKNSGLHKFVATLFYSGFAPVAPGTAGSAVAAVLYFFGCASLGAVGWLVLLAVAFAVGVRTASVMAAEWGEDPGPVVIDEGVGFLFTVALLPHGAGVAIAGFLVFRVLDIFKPPPARQAESLPGGWGIVVDDVVAGIYGNLLLRAGIHGLQWWSGR
jgi:phosphatidylglycerophosphatase A